MPYSQLNQSAERTWSSNAREPAGHSPAVIVDHRQTRGNATGRTPSRRWRSKITCPRRERSSCGRIIRMSTTPASVSRRLRWDVPFWRCWEASFTPSGSLPLRARRVDAGDLVRKKLRPASDFEIEKAFQRLANFDYFIDLASPGQQVIHRLWCPNPGSCFRSLDAQS